MEDLQRFVSYGETLGPKTSEEYLPGGAARRCAWRWGPTRRDSRSARAAVLGSSQSRAPVGASVPGSCWIRAHGWSIRMSSSAIALRLSVEPHRTGRHRCDLSNRSARSGWPRALHREGQPLRGVPAPSMRPTELFLYIRMVERRHTTTWPIVASRAPHSRAGSVTGGGRRDPFTQTSGLTPLSTVGLGAHGGVRRRRADRRHGRPDHVAVVSPEPPTPRSAPAISNPVIVLDAEPHDV